MKHDVTVVTLPTLAMLKQAAFTPTTEGQRYIRLAFDRKISRLKKLRLENNVDDSTPSLHFLSLIHISEPTRPY